MNTDWIGIVDGPSRLGIVGPSTYEDTAILLVTDVEQWLDQADVDDTSYIIEEAGGDHGHLIEMFGIRIYMRELCNDEPDPHPKPDLFWVAWAKDAYEPSFIREKVPELKVSGLYWGVRVVGSYYIEVQVAVNPHDVGYMHRDEWAAMLRRSE